MNKLLRGMFAAFVAVVLVGSSVKGIRNWLDNRDAAIRSQITLQVNDSTKAQSALLKIERDSLAALVDAAKTMHGDLVAGVKIVVKSDTVLVPVKEVVTIADSSGTRRADRTDTTTAGYIVKVSAEAPPAPAPLKLGFELTTPEFAPEVGFVKRKEGYYAVVSWGGQTFNTTSAFYKPQRERPLSVVAGAEVRGSPDDNAVGMSLRGAVFGALQFSTARSATQLRLGHDGRPFAGLAYTRRLW